MTLASSRIMAAAKGWLRTPFGRQFSRFVPVAGAAFIAGQVTLTICLGPAHLTAGVSGAAGWFAGAAVSYVLSRWAWRRKGRPHLLKETLPFWLVSIGAGLVLTLTAKWANQQALSMGLSHPQRVLFVDAAFFIANCVTFLSRFVIFHYLLFADRGSKTVPSPAVGVPPSATPGPAELAPRPAQSSDGMGSDRTAPASSSDETGPGRFAAAMGSARVNGSSAWSAAPAAEGSPAERSPARRPATGDDALPEPGTRC